MPRNDAFERALAALLDDVPIPDADPSPRTTPLRLLEDVATAHRRLMGGDREEDGPSTPDRGQRWGHLELLDPVGRGASATVYRAWDTRLCREVALKLFDAESVDVLDALTEGQRLASLRHPHLVTVYGSGTFDGLPGVWMEYINGETIDQVVARSGGWPLDALLVAGRDLAAALAALHDRHLLHRDVKARNVIRERGGRVVLMDLGAGLEASHPTTGPTQGTPLYMAPEILAGDPASERSDLYALGVLLYFAVSGTYPVEASTLSELIERHRTGRRRPLSQACPAVQRDVIDLIESCCAADQSRRPASARAVEAACAEILARTVETAHLVPSVLDLAWARAVRPLSVAASLCALVTMVGIAGWDSQPIRDLRWATGHGAPSSLLYLTSQGTIERWQRGHLTLFRANPTGATPLAVSTSDGLVATMGGTPPFEQGGQVVPVDGGGEFAIGADARLCCFNDGTTDGRYNYAIRRDDTRAPGTRVLAGATLFRFTRTWQRPEPLFDLSRTADYFGIAYVPHRDVFVVSWTGRELPAGRLEIWSRDGRCLSVLASTRTGLLGVAYDPADRTVWAVRDGGDLLGLELLVFDLNGRQLGSFAAERDRRPGAGGLEFPLPAPGSIPRRLWRRLGELWPWTR